MKRWPFNIRSEASTRPARPNANEVSLEATQTMPTPFRKYLAVGAMFLAFAGAGMAQDSSSSPTKEQSPAPSPAAEPAAAPPAPLPTPSTSGPLQLALPTNIEPGKIRKDRPNGAATRV